MAFSPSEAAAAMVGSRRGLAVLSRLCGEDLDVWPRRFPGPLDDPTAHPFDTRLPALDTTSPFPASLDDPERLIVEVLHYGSGRAWWGDDRLGVEAVTRRGPAFLHAARELLSASAASWWADDMLPDQQVVLGCVDAPPDLAARAAGQFRMLGPPWFGRIPGVLTTSRRLGARLPAVGLCDPDVSLLTRGPAGCWAVRVDPGARVWEVHGVEDWRALLERYPLRVSTTDDLRRWGIEDAESVVPDWESFASDWDGVHVSVLGLLTSQSVPVGVDGPHGLRGVLEDVDTEVTAWFRPRFTVTELIATIPEDEFPHGLPWP